MALVKGNVLYCTGGSISMYFSFILYYLLLADAWIGGSHVTT